MEVPNILIADHYPKKHPIYAEMGARTGEIKARKREELQIFLDLLFGGRKIDITICEPQFNSLEQLQHLSHQEWSMILLSGSPHNIDEGHDWMAREQQMFREMIQMEMYSRILGICAGHQIIHSALGGRVKHVDEAYNWGTVNWVDINGKSGKIHRSHGSHVTKTARDFEVLSRFFPENDRRPGIVHETISQNKDGRHILTVQGHPEKNPSAKNIQRIRRLLKIQ